MSDCAAATQLPRARIAPAIRKLVVLLCHLACGEATAQHASHKEMGDQCDSTGLDARAVTPCGGEGIAVRRHTLCRKHATPNGGEFRVARVSRFACNRVTNGRRSANSSSAAAHNGRRCAPGLSVSGSLTLPGWNPWYPVLYDGRYAMTLRNLRPLAVPDEHARGPESIAHGGWLYERTRHHCQRDVTNGTVLQTTNTRPISSAHFWRCAPCPRSFHWLYSSMGSKQALC